MESQHARQTLYPGATPTTSSCSLFLPGAILCRCGLDHLCHDLTLCFLCTDENVISQLPVPAAFPNVVDSNSLKYPLSSLSNSWTLYFVIAIEK